MLVTSPLLQTGHIYIVVNRRGGGNEKLIRQVEYGFLQGMTPDTQVLIRRRL